MTGLASSCGAPATLLRSGRPLNHPQRRLIPRVRWRYGSESEHPGFDHIICGVAPGTRRRSGQWLVWHDAAVALSWPGFVVAHLALMPGVRPAHRPRRRDLGIHREALRLWVRQDEADGLLLTTALHLQRDLHRSALSSRCPFALYAAGFAQRP